MAILSPQPRLRFFDSAGNPWSGAKLYTYQSGTSTLLATTDSTGAANPNPVVADADGYMDVRLSAASYKLVLTAPDGDPASPVWTVDNVDGAFLSLVATSDQTIASGIILPNGKTISWVAGASITGAADGELSLNVPTGETVNLQVNGVTKASLSATGLTVTGALSASGIGSLSTLTVGASVTPDSGAIKHQRITTGSVAASGQAGVAVTWVTAFLDTNYTASAVVVDGNASLRVRDVSTFTTTGITVTIDNTDAVNARTGTLHVIAIHD